MYHHVCTTLTRGEEIVLISLHYVVGAVSSIELSR
jgi:hypothetical protein